MKLIELLQNTPFSEDPIFNQAEIERVQFYRQDGHTDLTIGIQEIPSFQHYLELTNYFNQVLGKPIQLFLHVEHPELINPAEFGKYLNFMSRSHSSVGYFANATMTYKSEDFTCTFLFTNQERCNLAKDKMNDFINALHTIGMDRLHVECAVKDNFSRTTESVHLEPIVEAPKVEPVKKKNNFYRMKRKDYPTISLKDAHDGVMGIQFVGRVFAKEDFEIKSTHRIIQSLSVFDGEDAIVVKRFEGRVFSREDLDSVKVNDTIRVYGNFKYDSYAKDLVCEAEEIEQVEVSKQVDTAEEKRIELHTHSNMSEMDGVCAATDLVQYAWDIGHDGIVITDHADVQGFVKAFNKGEALKKKNPDRPFKVGLGCELNMADDHLTIVRNPIDTPIDDATYVSFDLETTGLSCYYDHIIEFGAVRMKNQTVIDRKQMFIKPPVPIPAFITSKTNITNDMVKNAKSFEECIDEILDWIGDDVLVAHNATFDYFFLNEELRRLNRPPLTNPIIDTLDMSRAILKERRAYRLGNIARFYRISYDEEVAHRADYDAEALSGVFLCLLRDAQKMGAQTIRDLQERIQDEDAYKKVRRSHIIALAKDKEGLKTLYKFVSMSNTDTLAVNSKGSEISAEPRVLRSIIDQHREHLLIGSSCQNNEVFELACNGDDARLEEAIKWYDYIEVQPPSNYSTLVALGSIPDSKRVKDVLKRIIKIAEKLGKTVVADSDAHYCSPDQKIFRDVYIMSQGVGGVTHPLYIRDEALRLRTKNPDQHIRMTNEMLKEFEWLEDPQLIRRIVLDNPHKIFQLLEPVRPVPTGTYPPKIEGSDDMLRDICYTTMKNLYEFEGKVPDIVKDRLDTELDNIIRNGFGVHYYIAHLLVKKSNDDGYVVGSRGSVGSSFTATMSGITEVNPMGPHYLCPNCHHSEWLDGAEVKSGFDLPDKICPHCGATMKGNGHNIPFQTFLGFNADKTPDIDLNFSNEYQANAHAFIKEVFGEQHAFRAGTIGTVAEKTAYGYVSGYCEKMNITDMRRPMRDYLAANCTDVKRTTGQHPGGIIIIPEEYDAEDFTPVQYPANDPSSEWKTTHYDFHDIHDNVLKFDILGHVDPTAMRLLTSVSEHDPRKLPMNDPKVLSLFHSDEALNADTRIYHKETGALGLPEFGTATTRRILEETRPHHFSELVMISGISHGTDVWAGNAQVLVQNGHPLEEVIACRDDIMTYLLNKNLEPIDAFKIMEDVRKGRGLTEKFENTMREHNVPEWYIESCKKIKYMFPKAHAVAYVMMAVRIAWYKVYEPHNFYIQYLTLRCDAYEIDTMMKGIEAIRTRMQDIQERQNPRNTTNPASNKEKALYSTLEVCEELYARGYKIGNIDLYRSKATEFTVDENNNHIIIPPFSVLDGLGANVARSIVAAREQGEFLSKDDILKRTQLSASTMRKLEIMGVLDGMQESNQISLF